MSTELDPQSSQLSWHHNRALDGEGTHITSSEKKRKRKSQVENSSPIKRRRHEEPQQTRNTAENQSGEHKIPGEKAIQRKKIKKSQQDRHQDGFPSIEAHEEQSSITHLNDQGRSHHSPFQLMTSTLYLPIPPICGSYPAQGLCADHLSPLLLSYYSPLQGVLLSYNNISLSSELPSEPLLWKGDRQKPPDPDQQYASIIESYGPYYTYLTADFLLFAPRKGDWLKGYVVLGSEANVGLICYNFFSASIEKKRLPKSWRWMRSANELQQTKRRRRKGQHNNNDEAEESGEVDPDVEMMDSDNAVFGEIPAPEGYWLTSSHPKAVLSGTIFFRVIRVEKARNADREHGLLTIEGTMLSEEDENQLVEEEIEKERKTEEVIAKRRREEGWMSGALRDGEDGEE